MDMKNERMMILDMIAEGKISAADGEQLFRALDQSAPVEDMGQVNGAFSDETPEIPGTMPSTPPWPDCNMGGPRIGGGPGGVQ